LENGGSEGYSNLMYLHTHTITKHCLSLQSYHLDRFASSKHTLLLFNTSENELNALKNTPLHSHLKHLATVGNNVKSYVRKEDTKTYNLVPQA
jgi:hypothetical protein